MARMDPRSGRTKGESKHVRDYEWMLACPAYRALSPHARCLLTELKRLYDGGNNGEIFLSVRDGASRINVHKDTASKAFRELEDHGFIRARVRGSFTLKARHSTTWILTEFGFAGQPGEKDFMRWRPPPNLGTGPTRSDRRCG